MEIIEVMKYVVGILMMIVVTIIVLNIIGNHSIKFVEFFLEIYSRLKKAR